MKVLAGIVLYNPDETRLLQNINAIRSQVDQVICIDNGSVNMATIKECLSDDIEIVQLHENLGIGTALNKIMEYAVRNKFDWFLTLDQDSVCMPELVEHYKGFITAPKAGILSCIIQDRNFTSEAAPLENIREIEECITSASLCNTAALNAVGGFDDAMFIDSVDFDVCRRLRKNDFKIYRIPFTGILHEVGHGKNVRLLWKKCVVYNHSPIRNYYMARNHIYMVKKYSGDISMLKTLLKELETELLILLYEDNKTKKLRARHEGLSDGFHNRMGKCTWL